MRPPQRRSATSRSLRVSQEKSLGCQFELGQRVAVVGVEPGRDQQEVGAKGNERRKDGVLVGGTISSLPLRAASGTLTILPAPVSLAAPVPGNSGIWWVEAYMTLGSS